MSPHRFVVLCLVGCSAIVDPDPSLLGGEVPDAASSDTGRDGSAGDATTGDATTGDAGPCPRPATCEGNVLVRCEGASVVNRDCGADRCDASLGECVPVGDWRPSNVDASYWDDDADDLRIEEHETIDTDRCEGHVERPDAGVELCVLSVRNFEVTGEGRLRIVGSRPLVLMAAGEVRLAGVIDLSARGVEPGPGGFRGGIRDLREGGGPGGGGGGAHEGEFEDGGGGGGGFCGAGGRGGHGGEATGGAAGPAAGASLELQPLIGGSGGGRGRGLFAPTGRNAGFGGAGGGALQISARQAIRFDGGAILAGGGGGEGGRAEVGNWGSGGGGGAGGGILLEAPMVLGPGRLNVAGGGGGGAAAGGDGNDGQDAVNVGVFAAGGSGARKPGGATIDGGDGAGGARIDGNPGEDEDRNPWNGAGGGGGGGCVVVRLAEPFPPSGLNVTPRAAPVYQVLPLRY